MLTFELNSGYADVRVQSSNTSGQTAPIVLAGFFVSDSVGSVANILNMPTCLVSGFELPTPHGLRVLFKEGYKI